jgi:flagellin
LASGSRIVTASDDAAGWAIAETMRGQLAGIGMARKNAFNAISMIQVSEGGLSELSNILIRIRELGVQAASDNIGDEERGFIDNEAQQLMQEFDRIVLSTRFGSRQVLTGSGEQFEFQVGAFGDEEANVVRYSIEADATASTLGVEGLSIADKDSAREALGMVDEGIHKIGQMRADFGAVQSRLQTTTRAIDVQIEMMSAAKSRMADADIAYETAELASGNILQQSAIATMAHANQSQQE